MHFSHIFNPFVRYHYVTVFSLSDDESRDGAVEEMFWMCDLLLKPSYDRYLHHKCVYMLSFFVKWCFSDYSPSNKSLVQLKSHLGGTYFKKFCCIIISRHARKLSSLRPCCYHIVTYYTPNSVCLTCVSREWSDFESGTYSGSTNSKKFIQCTFATDLIVSLYRKFHSNNISLLVYKAKTQFIAYIEFRRLFNCVIVADYKSMFFRLQWKGKLSALY